MPREFYPDTDTQNLVAPIDEERLCGNTIELFDGPAICMRPKGHKVDATSPTYGQGQFHQEGFEGWVWDNKGRVG